MNKDQNIQKIKAYKIAHEENAHFEMLSSIIQKWSNSEPEVFLISKEGHKIYTQSLILRFYSKWLPEVLDGVKDDVGISVAASSNSIGSFLKVLSSGVVFTKVKTDLLEIGDIAESLGINFENWQIGEKKKKDSSKDIKKKIKFSSLERKEDSIESKEETLQESKSIGSKMLKCEILAMKIQINIKSKDMYKFIQIWTESSSVSHVRFHSRIKISWNITKQKFIEKRKKEKDLNV